MLKGQPGVWALPFRAAVPPCATDADLHWSDEDECQGAERHDDPDCVRKGTHRDPTWQAGDGLRARPLRHGAHGARATGARARGQPNRDAITSTQIEFSQLIGQAINPGQQRLPRQAMACIT